MRLPPEPILVAAKRWLELLSSSGGVPRAQALLTSHPEYSDLTPTQYAAALAWIRDAGLIAGVGARLPAAYQVLSAIFEKAPPPWVRDADVLVQSPEELPTEVIDAGAVLGLDPDAVYGQLVASWGKVDTSIREQVGAAGEAALVNILRDNTSGHVDHVSTWNDGLGYDIAYADDTVAAHLEVKSTTRLGRFTIYLSRNEHSVMLRDRWWALIAIRLTTDLDVDGIGWVPSRWIAQNVPRDVGQSGSWASCKLEIPPDVIVDGIPQLGDSLSVPVCRW